MIEYPWERRRPRLHVFAFFKGTGSMLLALTISATTTNPWPLSCEPTLLVWGTASIQPHLSITLLASVSGVQAGTPALPGEAALRKWFVPRGY